MHKWDENNNVQVWYLIVDCGNTPAKYGDADCSILLHVEDTTQYFKPTEIS